MNNMTLNDKAVKALSLVMDAECGIEEINDYGEVTGFREEYEQLVRDFDTTLGSLSVRGSLLTRRLRKYHSIKALQ